jgi:hypothetical protein
VSGPHIPQVFRNRGFSQLLTLVAVVFAAGSIVLAVTRDEASGGGRWGPAAVVIAISLFTYFRLARAGVYASDQGIRVVNPFRTEFVPWHHLTRFVARPHKGFPALGFAQRLDGTEVELWGIQARSPSTASKRVVEELVGELNDQLFEARKREPTGPPRVDP